MQVYGTYKISEDRMKMLLKDALPNLYYNVEVTEHFDTPEGILMELGEATDAKSREAIRALAACTARWLNARRDHRRFDGTNTEYVMIDSMMHHVVFLKARVAAQGEFTGNDGVESLKAGAL